MNKNAKTTCGDSSKTWPDWAKPMWFFDSAHQICPLISLQNADNKNAVDQCYLLPTSIAESTWLIHHWVTYVPASGPRHRNTIAALLSNSTDSLRFSLLSPLLTPSGSSLLTCAASHPRLPFVGATVRVNKMACRYRPDRAIGGVDSQGLAVSGAIAVTRRLTNATVRRGPGFADIGERHFTLGLFWYLYLRNRPDTVTTRDTDTQPRG